MEEQSLWQRLTDPSFAAVVVGFLTLITTHLLTALSDKRRRKEIREDAERERRERKEDAAQLLKEQRESDRITHQKIDENTAVSIAAFTEANTVNQKIKFLGETLVVGQKEQTEELKRDAEEPVG